MIHCLHLELVLNARALTHVPPSPLLPAWAIFISLHLVAVASSSSSAVVNVVVQPYLDTGAGTGLYQGLIHWATKEKKIEKKR